MHTWALIPTKPPISSSASVILNLPFESCGLGLGVEMRVLKNKLRPLVMISCITAQYVSHPTHSIWGLHLTWWPKRQAVATSVLSFLLPVQHTPSPKRHTPLFPIWARSLYHMLALKPCTVKNMNIHLSLWLSPFWPPLILASLNQILVLTCLVSAYPPALGNVGQILRFT